MKSAKEFAAWLMNRFSTHADVYLTRKDITELTSRQSLRSEFIHDVHCELMGFGRALVADVKNDRYYMVAVSNTYWKDVGDVYAATSEQTAGCEAIKAPSDDTIRPFKTNT
ncbi:hypothetical protein LRP49_07690 [Enterovibrio sp. ZSDZ35]|uniref:Uncharacterized protein n=1 Tax=Enterovibrio qingdaonensis TaxID=2899818 RepID=A0ABT5QJP4_9GAMM|nr:hypothetical protein [Enterovibrio sp. ZSDZ35]MDD1781084.1 hypothetical protein [Enterovibrio sp. ZSDZ35]